GLPGNEPGECDPGVIRGDTRCICPGAHRKAASQHSLNGRRALRGGAAVALDEVFPLERHAMLNGDAAAEFGYAVDIAIRDRFAVIEEPMQSVEGSVAVDPLIDIKRAGDRLVVGRMEPPGPTMLSKQSHDGLQISLHRGRQIGTRDAKIFEVRSGVDEHLARPVVTIKVVPLPRTHLARPVAKIREFLFGLLRKQVVGEADGQLSGRVQLFDDAIVFGVILKSTSSVDDACHTEPIYLSHEMTTGVLLILT